MELTRGITSPTMKAWSSANSLGRAVGSKPMLLSKSDLLMLLKVKRLHKKPKNSEGSTNITLYRKIM
jgi:hypothetical protein